MSKPKQQDLLVDHVVREIRRVIPELPENTRKEALSYVITVLLTELEQLPEYFCWK